MNNSQWMILKVEHWNNEVMCWIYYAMHRWVYSFSKFSFIATSSSLFSYLILKISNFRLEGHHHAFISHSITALFYVHREYVNSPWFQMKTNDVYTISYICFNESNFSRFIIEERSFSLKKAPCNECIINSEATGSYNKAYFFLICNLRSTNSHVWLYFDFLQKIFCHSIFMTIYNFFCHLKYLRFI